MTRLRLFIPGLLLVCPGVGAAPVQTAPPFSSFDVPARELLGRMTLDEKVGQMTQADQEFIADDEDVERYFLGSVLSGGDSDPKGGNRLQDWTEMYDRLQSRALRTRLRIPILYGVDAVHGHNNVVGAVIFPHNIGLGATRNPSLVEEIARVTAKEVRATGVQWTFAPCVAVPQDARWGRTYEGFSEDPALVAELGAAAVRGYQGEDLRDPLRVLACAKHYVGDGGTTWGTGWFDREGRRRGAPLDQGDTRVDEPTLRRLHLPGYLTAIPAGVGTIMPSYSSWNGQKLSGHRYLLTDVLKGELGFQGFLISDYNAIDQLDPDYRAAVRLSINAGMDMVMAPRSYRQFFTTLKSLVENGEVPLSRIDDAVLRILRVKLAMGLMDPGRSPLADRSLHRDFGAAAHRELARRAVRESLVLLKNVGRVLPLSREGMRIHVAGGSADDLGYQCGGWTVRWQGSSGRPTTGTTILEGIRAAAGPKAAVTYSKDGEGARGAAAAVVVVGETPYAEGRGDREDLSLGASDLAAVAAVKAAGVPVVLVVVSGRPLLLGAAAEQADAIVAAWLPGSEGDGVAEVLFGTYRPTGKLSFTWPRTAAQVPHVAGSAGSDPLFAFGFGETY